MIALATWWKAFTDFEKSQVKRGLESLGPRYCKLVVNPLRVKLGERTYWFPGWLLTTANGMTTIGLVLSFLAAGELLLGFKQLAFWLFLVSRIPDIIDGWIARYAEKVGHESPIFDSNSDKAGIIAALAVLYWGVITHPSVRAWVCIWVLVVVDLGNLGLNLYHARFERRARRDALADQARSGHALQAAINMMSKLAGKVKHWGWSFLVASLLFIVAFPSLRSHGVWGLFWVALVVTCFGALGSCAGKVRDWLALRRARVATVTS